MTLAKYAVAVLLWALFYFVCALAVALGFGLGWRLIGNGKPLSLPKLKLPRKEVSGNGSQPATATTTVPAG